MEDNEIESGNNLEVAEQEETVESTVENTEESNVEETQEASEETTENKETVVEEKPKQSAEDNKAARLARLQAEKDVNAKIEKARKEAYEKGLEQGKVQQYIGRTNPYTNKPIVDEYDVKEYLAMYEADNAGQDPIKAYIEQQKETARAEEKNRIEAENKKKQAEWYQKDANDFIAKHGEDKLQELTKDEDFDNFAKGKIGNQPLAEIYDDYRKLIAKYEQKSVQTAKQLIANGASTPGKADSGEAKTLDWNSMSPKQFEEYVQKAVNGELK